MEEVWREIIETSTEKKRPASGLMIVRGLRYVPRTLVPPSHNKCIRRQTMEKLKLFVGLDVHKESTDVAFAETARTDVRQLRFIV